MYIDNLQSIFFLFSFLLKNKTGTGKRKEKKVVATPTDRQTKQTDRQTDRQTDKEKKPPRQLSAPVIKPPK